MIAYYHRMLGKLTGRAKSHLQEQHASRPLLFWVLVKGFNLSYYNRKTILFTTDPYYGNLT